MPDDAIGPLARSVRMYSGQAMVHTSGALGARLATLMRPLIDEDLSVVFYDLTTVEVAGEAVLPDDVRAYGLSKSGLVARQFML